MTGRTVPTALFCCAVKAQLCGGRTDCIVPSNGLRDVGSVDVMYTYLVSWKVCEDEVLVGTAKVASKQPASQRMGREEGKQSLQPTKCSFLAATTPPEIDPCALNEQQIHHSLQPTACLRVCSPAVHLVLVHHPSIHPSIPVTKSHLHLDPVPGLPLPPRYIVPLSPASLPNRNLPCLPSAPRRERYTQHLDLPLDVWDGLLTTPPSS